MKINNEVIFNISDTDLTPKQIGIRVLVKVRSNLGKIYEPKILGNIFTKRLRCHKGMAKVAQCD